MIRVTDFIADYIYKQGVEDIFLVTGGGMMFLSDGIAKHPHLRGICPHHEQAAAMAAVSYSKFNQNLGAAYLTTGCGGTNAITGVLNAWQDNIPCLFISGQSKRKETVRNSGLELRQFGVQEADIIAIVQPITKYSVMINNPEEIQYHLEKAVYLAKNGRPGPVWLDIPLDVQGALIEPSQLKKFNPDELKLNYKEIPTDQEIKQLKTLLEQSKRPIIIAGQGIRLGKSINTFKNFIEKLNIPFVTSRLGIDVLPSDHPLYIGRIGNKGDRAGNFAVQNSDLVLSIGSRLSVSSTGHEYNTFAREAKIVVVDIDPVEHKKNTVRIDLFINAHVQNFLTSNIVDTNMIDHSDWVKKCQKWKEKWPVCLPEYSKIKNAINLYYFTEVLSQKLKKDSVVISDAGSAFYVASQGLKLKDEQRYITSGGQAEMGYTLPAIIGASIAKNNSEVIGITGDGSLQMNIQEFQTIKHLGLPVKLFVWNNDGYLSIRATQSKFFENRYLGTDSKSGLSFPDLKKVAKAYGLKYFKISQSNKLAKGIEKVLKYNEPVICEVICIPNQEIVPTVSSFRKDDGSMVSKPIEDMYPFLSRDEFQKEMIVKPLDESL